MAGHMSREPIKLTLLKGKKHLTKAEIEQRKQEEVKVGSDKVKAPKYLPKELKPEFKKISEELIRIGIMTDLDNDALARFLIAREQYVKAMETLREIDPSDDIVYYDRVLKVQDKLYQQVNSASKEIGLSVNARGKLLVPKISDKKISEVEEKFGV